jgi:hypothetical protein
MFCLDMPEHLEEAVDDDFRDEEPAFQRAWALARRIRNGTGGL